MLSNPATALPLTPCCLHQFSAPISPSPASSIPPSPLPPYLLEKNFSIDSTASHLLPDFYTLIDTFLHTHYSLKFQKYNFRVCNSPVLPSTWSLVPWPLVKCWPDLCAASSPTSAPGVQDTSCYSKGSFSLLLCCPPLLFLHVHS